MTTYYLNGTPLVKDADITINGFTYPYSWLEGTSPSIRASLGIEKDGDINYNEKYYNAINVPKPLEDREEIDEDGNPVYVKILSEVDGQPTMIDSDKRVITKGLKSSCILEIKIRANNLLSSTDYYIIRNAIEELEIPSSVSQYRAAIIAEQERVTAAIPTVTNIEELIEIMNSVNFPELK